MSLSVATRYWLTQLPGWGVSAALLFALWEWAGVPGWVAGALFALFVAKDAALYPLVRRSLLAPHRAGADALLGRTATVVERLAPEGAVRIGAERWRARVRRAEAPVEAGRSVRVERVEGLTLLVAPSGDEA